MPCGYWYPTWGVFLLWLTALIVTISQNSVGNAITELLGVVVKRTPDAEAYEKAEPALIEKLLEVRGRLIEADLGEGIGTEYWGKD